MVLPAVFNGASPHFCMHLRIRVATPPFFPRAGRRCRCRGQPPHPCLGQTANVGLSIFLTAERHSTRSHACRCCHRCPRKRSRSVEGRPNRYRRGSRATRLTGQFKSANIFGGCISLLMICLPTSYLQQFPCLFSKAPFLGSWIRNTCRGAALDGACAWPIANSNSKLKRQGWSSN